MKYDGIYEISLQWGRLVISIWDVEEEDAPGLEYFLQKTPDVWKTSALCSQNSKKFQVCEMDMELKGSG